MAAVLSKFRDWVNLKIVDEPENWEGEVDFPLDFGIVRVGNACLPGWSLVGDNFVAGEVALLWGSCGWQAKLSASRSNFQVSSPPRMCLIHQPLRVTLKPPSRERRDRD